MLGLYYSLQKNSYPSTFAWVISVYVLFDSVGATFRDVVVSPIQNVDQKGSFISIDSPSRWLLTSFINVLMVIVAFAILFLHYGDQFQPIIVDSTTAIYMSVITITTLGYGDIRPVCAIGKKLVCVELFYFLFFLAVKLPIAVSAIRAKTRDTS
jgi:membrane-anchored glycerophosphoryl diester phosphodiesterase (GDPDase)